MSFLGFWYIYPWFKFLCKKPYRNKNKIGILAQFRKQESKKKLSEPESSMVDDTSKSSSFATTIVRALQPLVKRPDAQQNYQNATSYIGLSKDSTCPLIEIYLFKRPEKAFALIDTGSDVTLISKDLCMQLCIPIN